VTEHQDARMPHRWIRRLAAVALAAILLAVPAGSSKATRVRELSLTEMVADAGAIFAGRVESVAGDRGRGIPVTRVTFQVEENVRGAGSETITLTFLGGRLPSGLPYRIAGMPHFQPGQRVVLLAYQSSSIGLTSPVGLYQGHFPISAGPRGSERVTAPGPRRRLLEGVEVLAGGSPTALPPEAAPGAATITPRSFPYGEFLQALRELASREGPPDRQAPSAPSTGGQPPAGGHP
jgi:hypothetical protein